MKVEHDRELNAVKKEQERIIVRLAALEAQAQVAEEGATPP